MRSFVVLVLALVALPAAAQEITIRPYVQDVGTTSAWILWETTTGEESRVEWGPTEALGMEASGGAHPSTGAHRVHEVALTGLSPSTRYHYVVHTGGATAGPFHFTTKSDDRETSFRMIAVSDMQHDESHPEVWGEVIHDGILAFLAEETARPDDGLAFLLVPGDLVDRGSEHTQWIERFFAPAADLLAYVPAYPTLGNHEADTHFYYDYFRLPQDESHPDPDRYWRFDHGNVRMIGLDSNLLLLFGAQEAFFDEALVDACSDDAIDFVFVAMHHAHHSELWPDGEAGFASTAVTRVDRFSRECGKPAAMFYGHTHGYARGGSRDVPHLWINVASAGGRLDRWGSDDAQYDDPETQVSQDEYGFVVLDVVAGDAPRFTLRRIGMGQADTSRARVLRDEITVRRYDAAPTAPTPVAPRGRVAPGCTMLRTGDFADSDGDLHGATHWQVADRCTGFDEPLLERYRVHENWFAGEDLQAGDDLRDEGFDELATGRFYCWRARHRDRGLAWSDWSGPTAFRLEADGDVDCVDEAPVEPDPLPPPTPVGIDGGSGSVPTGEGGGGCHAAGTSAPAVSVLVLLAFVRRRRS
ncbi:MAG: metallophosphoesterase [Sandaracinus sp.]|nr:metallophosphoesterase [Sandaracinus sp.]MCB9618335.1 metallophosphoesterase [Sandaracinus sp.]